MYYNNYENGETIICPYCGKEYTPSYEDTFIGGELIECYAEELQFCRCDKCNKKFSVFPSYTWKYETNTIEGEMTEEEAEEKGYA